MLLVKVLLSRHYKHINLIREASLKHDVVSEDIAPVSDRRRGEAAWRVGQVLDDDLRRDGVAPGAEIDGKQGRPWRGVVIHSELDQVRAVAGLSDDETAGHRRTLRLLLSQLRVELLLAGL